MAEKLMRAPDGKIWEERDGKWYEVEGPRAGGMLAAQGMGLGEQVLVGAGRELTRLGRGAQSLMARVTGDDAKRDELSALEEEADAQIAGSSAAGAGAGLTAGAMLPGLATLPIGSGVGVGLGRFGKLLAGRRLAGADALAEQVGTGALLGGVGHSGDQGLDAMTGALLGAGGFGTGALASRVMGMIKDRGIATRAAVMDAASNARGAMSAEEQRLRTVAMGGADNAAAPAGVGGGAGGVGAGAGGPAAGPAAEPIRFGQATRPGAEALAAGGALPGAAAGAPGLTAEQSRLADRAGELGIQLTPGQRVGSTAQQYVEEGLKSSPYTAGLFERQVKHNVRRIGELATAAIGEEGSELTQRVLNNAHERIGQVFDNVAQRVGTIAGDSPVLQDASDALYRIVAAAGEGAATVPEVGAAASRLAQVWEQGGQVTGERLLRERTRLVKRSRQFSREGDQLAAEGIHDVVSVIDDIIGASVPRAARSAVDEARAQWRMLASLESGAAMDVSTGQVRTAALLPALRREFPMEFERGNMATTFGRTRAGAEAAKLMDAVRITQAFKSVVGNSGTATRLSMQGLLTNPLVSLLQGAGLAGAGGLYMGGGGLMASRLAGASNAAPAAAAAGGGLLRAPPGVGSEGY